MHMFIKIVMTVLPLEKLLVAVNNVDGISTQ